MKVVYIIGKYSDESHDAVVKNMRKAQMKAVELAELGYCVITPHSNFMLHDISVGYEGIMKQCYELIKKSDLVYVLDNWRSSKGSKKEIALAQKLKKNVLWQEKGA